MCVARATGGAATDRPVDNTPVPIPLDFLFAFFSVFVSRYEPASSKGVYCQVLYEVAGQKGCTVAAASCCQSAYLCVCCFPFRPALVLS